VIDTRAHSRRDHHAHALRSTPPGVVSATSPLVNLWPCSSRTKAARLVTQYAMNPVGGWAC